MLRRFIVKFDVHVLSDFYLYLLVRCQKFTNIALLFFDFHYIMQSLGLDVTHMW